MNEALSTERVDSLQALARAIGSKHADTGALARVRRHHPDDGPEALFDIQAFLLAAGIDAAPDRFADWALVAHCLAIVGGRHRDGLSTGQILGVHHLSEARLRLLVEADGPLLRELLPRLARRLASAGVEINWWPLANLLGLGATKPDDARRELIRGFLIGAAASKH